jgi:hypothetical protein
MCVLQSRLGEWKKNDLDIVNLFCFRFRDVIFEWGENFMKAHPVYTFEKLEATFCKHYRKVQTD